MKQIQKQIPIQASISIQQNHENKTYWEQDGNDFILHLGTMRKAIVVAAYSDAKKDGLIGACLTNKIRYYSISPRSYFPFDSKDYERKFDNSEDCKKHAITCVKNWLESVFVITQGVDKS